MTAKTRTVLEAEYTTILSAGNTQFITDFNLRTALTDTADSCLNLLSDPYIASLTTTGTSGAATLTGSVLNIPNYPALPNNTANQILYGNGTSTPAQDNNLTWDGTKLNVNGNIYGAAVISSIGGYTLTRNTPGYITKKAYANGTAMIYSRDGNNFVTSKTDGTHTWTYARNTLGQVTGRTVV